MKSDWKIKPSIVFVTLSILFLVFSASIYLKPMNSKVEEYKAEYKASQGRLVWQKYNCHTCHQLYGLGGYMGPDLTNVYGKYQGNSAIMTALFKGGFKQMPTFNLSQKEENLLISFLKSTNDSGNADPRNYTIFSNGMIKQND